MGDASAGVGCSKLSELRGVARETVGGGESAVLTLGAASGTGSRPSVEVVGKTVTEVGGNGWDPAHHGGTAGETAGIGVAGAGGALHMAWHTLQVQAVVEGAIRT